MRKIYFLLSLLLFQLSVFPQKPFVKVTRLSLEEGLSQSNVRCILQDKNGFLWIGTQDGLNRFDGYQFTKFRRESRNPNSLSGNYISCITEDKDGKIIIGTINGVTIYDPRLNLFKQLTIKDSIYNINEIGSVSSILCARDGSIWIGDYYSGLIRIKKNKTVRFRKEADNPNSISANYITALCEDKDGNIWIGTFGSGLNKYDIKTKKFEHIGSGSGNNQALSSNSITSLCSNRKGNLFIGTTGGLNVLDLSTNTITVYKNNPSYENSISGNNILSIYSDKKDNVWLAIEGKGVNVFDVSKGTFTKIYVESKTNPSGEEKNIWSIYEDSNDNFWFGTSTNGVIKWKKNSSNFKSFTQETNQDHLSDYSIRSIFVDRENNIWIGTDYGLNKILANSGRVKKYYHNTSDKTSINDNKIWAIAEDKKDNIWIGTQRGLALYDKRRDAFKRFVYNANTKESLPVFGIRCLYFDDNNLLWFGTYGSGLFSYDIQKNKFYDHTFNIANPDAKKDVVIFQIYEDDNGKLWLVAPSGLASYDKKTKKYERFFSDSQNDYTGIQCVLYSLLKEDDSTIWLGTLGDGLIKFNHSKKQYKFYTEKDGLANNVVYAMLKDNKGDLWLSTNYGISKFDIRTKQFKNYDKNDGLPTDEFNTGAFTADKKNNLYFGGIEGLLFFNPDSINSNTSKPNIAVTNFKVFNKAISSNKVYFDREEISLDYNDNFFSFEFASLDLTASSKNEYAYKLEGYDKEWIYSGKIRYAAYTNVDPGEYILKVKASNNDRSWNEAGIKIRLIITPPFWRTLWFRIIAVIIFLSLVIYFYKRRTNQLKREVAIQQKFSKQLIESQENERKRIASELHDGLGQNLLIISNLAQIGLRNSDIDFSKKQLSSITENAQESIEEVRRIAHNLHPYQLDELGLSSALQSMLKKLSNTTSLNLSTYIEHIDGYIKSDQYIHLFRVVQEGMNNIIKHANAQNVVISISKLENTIQIIIKDDGKGMDDYPEDKEKKPSGFGLQKIRERIKVLNGNLSIDSSPLKGTTIKILIPVVRNEE